MAWRAFIFIVTLGATLSPLFTYAWLWQLKEWRTDRLREQLIREGWFPTLLGRSRPVIFAVVAILLLLLPRERTTVLTLGLLGLACLSLLPFLRGQQRSPRWTRKAMSIVAGAMLLNVLITLAVMSARPALLLLLPLVQPLVLAFSWALFLPVDRVLKHRILTQARSARQLRMDLTVIGITGSVGKTTTKELLGHILQDLHPRVTPAYMNAEIGVAQWLRRELAAMAPDDVSPFVIEMGAYGKGEIATLCSFTLPTVGIVTAVSDQHLALFGSEEAIAEAKGELIEALPETGRAFLNGDQPIVAAMAARARCPVTLVGTGGRLDMEAFEVSETPTGIQFRTEDTLLQIPLRGTHNVTNVLLATAAALHLGVRLPRIAELLRSFRPPHQTFAVREERGVTVLDDTHNASSSSIRAAITWAKTQPQEEKTLLVAGLIELGEKRAQTERELGGLCRGIFKRVVVLDPVSAAHYREGFGEETELFSTTTARVGAGSLLVCLGRMSPKTLSQLLP